MKLTFRYKGGEGSGHFDHSGRPGKHGGSLPGKGGESSTPRTFADRTFDEKYEITDVEFDTDVRGEYKGSSAFISVKFKTKFGGKPLKADFKDAIKKLVKESDIFTEPDKVRIVNFDIDPDPNVYGGYYMTGLVTRYS
jgi:hypothetical protein